jgi:alkaline phosphatase
MPTSSSSSILPPRVHRRAFLRGGVLCLAGLGTHALLAAEPEKKAALRLGLLTDLHYADKPEAGTRFYRETLGKLNEAVARFNAEELAAVVELGDLIDQAPSAEQELAWLKTIEERFATVRAPRHYVLGNHCVTTLTKEEFAAHTGASPTPHYSFDHGGFHFVILDACYRADGVAYARKNFGWKDTAIPAPELEWLRADLAAAGKPTIVFAHQRLDEAPNHCVRNHAAVRAELERSGQVLAVFQGHSHKNDYQQIAGIHYCTLVAMIEGSGLESSGYSLLEVLPDGSLRLQGFRRQIERRFARA